MTGSPIDRETLRQQTDFIGDLLQLSDDVQNDPASFTTMQDELDELYARGSRANRLLRDFLPTESELRELLSGAEELCLEKLLDEADRG